MFRNFTILLLLAFGLTISQSTARAQAPDSAWHLINSNVSTTLSRLQCATEDTIFFLGSNTDLQRTTNGGLSLLPVSLPQSLDTLHLDTNGTSFVHISRAHQIATIYGMSWPSQNTGYVLGETYPDRFEGSARPTVLRTTDGGTTWKQFYPSDTELSFTNVYFPTGAVGYASASLHDTSIVVMTTDSGSTWSMVMHSSNLIFNNIHFINAKNGMVFAQSMDDGSNHVVYTTDQWATSHAEVLPGGSLLNFIRWNADSSWVIAMDSSIYRSTDTGQHWATVVPADSMGNIVTCAFHDSMGFAFRSTLIDTMPNIVLSTRDYGAHWVSDTLPRISSNYLDPRSASMPSDSVAFLMAVDGGNFDLLSITIHSPAYYVGGGNNSVAITPSGTSGFSASAEQNEIVFTAASAPAMRTIQVMDILGRVCATVSLPPGASMSQLPMNELRAGGYFARLGDQVVKFSIWN